MKKIEFLTQLQNELAEGLDSVQIREQLEYYSGYIDDEVAKGRDEQEVIDDLGDPWAIANTILENSERRQGRAAARREQARRDAQADHDYANSQRRGGTGTYWLILIIAILIIFMIVSLVLGVMGFFLRNLPILFILIIVFWFLRRLRN